MDKAECARLEVYLRSLLGAGSSLSVKTSGDEEAQLRMGQKILGEILRDLDEGELSYCLSMSIPRAKGASKKQQLDDGERGRLEEVLKDTFGSGKIEVRARPRKTDSAEVYVANEFIGTLSTDEDEGYFFTVSILDVDLNEAR